MRRGDQTLPIPPKAFDTLVLLVRKPGHLILKGEFMNALWPDSFVEEVNLANNISALRKALGDDAADSRYIQTVPKQGYRFLPSVTSIWSGSSAQELSAQVQDGPAARAIRFIALPFRLVHSDERIDFLGCSLAGGNFGVAGRIAVDHRSLDIIGGPARGRPAGSKVTSPGRPTWISCSPGRS